MDKRIRITTIVDVDDYLMNVFRWHFGKNGETNREVLSSARSFIGYNGEGSIADLMFDYDHRESNE